MMNQGVEDFVHHAEMVVALVLLFHVHEIFIQGMEAGGEHFGDAKAGFGGGDEELPWIFNEGKGTGFQGADGDAMGTAQ